MADSQNMTAEHYQVDTEVPITNFRNCHIGILHHLEGLSELLSQFDNAQVAQKIAQETFNYFHLGMKVHHQEEELELVPAVLSSALPGEERNLVLRLIEKLTQQHRVLESEWKEIELALKAIIKGHPNTLDHVHFKLLINRYQTHASLEERDFLPLAEKILGRNSNHMAALGLSLHMRHLPQFSAHI